MLCLDQATVCKPLVPRELQFYETLPDSVRKFTPKFYGVVKVRVVQEGGYVTLIATPPACYKPIQSNDKRCGVYCRFLLAIIRVIICHLITLLLLWALTENVSSQEHLKWNLQILLLPQLWT